MKGRIGPLVFISVSGKDAHIHVTLQGLINDLTKAAQKIYDPVVQPRFWIEPAVIFHANMDIG